MLIYIIIIFILSWLFFHTIQYCTIPSLHCICIYHHLVCLFILRSAKGQHSYEKLLAFYYGLLAAELPVLAASALQAFKTIGFNLEDEEEEEEEEEE